MQVASLILPPDDLWGEEVYAALATFDVSFAADPENATYEDCTRWVTMNSSGRWFIHMGTLYGCMSRPASESENDALCNYYAGLMAR